MERPLQVHSSLTDTDWIPMIFCENVLGVDLSFALATHVKQNELFLREQSGHRNLHASIWRGLNDQCYTAAKAAKRYSIPATFPLEATSYRSIRTLGKHS